MKRIEDARLLARTIIGIGRAAGKRVSALITSMDQPIGRAVGNANEVVESIEILQDRGPADTRELTVALGAEMLMVAKVAASPTAARQMIVDVLGNGRAFERFCLMVEAQGGDVNAVRDPRRLPQPRSRRELCADRSGVITAIDARSVGVAAMMLGAGRRKAEDVIDPAVGIEVLRKVGEPVRAGEVLALLLVNDEANLPAAEALARTAYQIGDGPAPEVQPIVREILRDSEAEASVEDVRE
jgi:pyrimidine-nucleoside phosphorylase